MFDANMLTTLIILAAFGALLFGRV